VARTLTTGVVLASLALSACGNDADPGPGGVTVGESRALDEAAAMLDERRPPAEALKSSQPSGVASEAAE
jgi:hypothetical protein